MNILIIEDEPLAAERLQNLLAEYDKRFVIVAVLDSVKASINYLSNFAAPDLIFVDIMLADGQSFEIFEKIDVHIPVIFTTAYDEFALKAFKVNSIDYLLKPVDYHLLKQALNKFVTVGRDFQKIKSIMKSLIVEGPATYKSRFLVRVGETYNSLMLSEIAYFSYEDKLTFLYTNTAKRYMVDHSLDELETMLDPKLFFRLNRQYLSSHLAIKTVHPYFNSKLKVYLSPISPEAVTVSRERAGILKAWLDL